MMKSEKGSALLAVLVLMMVLTLVFFANSKAMMGLRGYLKHVEKEQIEKHEERHLRAGDSVTPESLPDPTKKPR